MEGGAAAACWHEDVQYLLLLHLPAMPTASGSSVQIYLQLLLLGEDHDPEYIINTSPRLTDWWLLRPSVLHKGPENVFCTSLIFAKLNIILAELVLQLTDHYLSSNKHDGCWREPIHSRVLPITSIFHKDKNKNLQC